MVGGVGDSIVASVLKIKSEGIDLDCEVEVTDAVKINVVFVFRAIARPFKPLLFLLALFTKEVFRYFAGTSACRPGPS